MDSDALLRLIGNLYAQLEEAEGREQQLRAHIENHECRCDCGHCHGEAEDHGDADGEVTGGPEDAG